MTSELLEYVEVGPSEEPMASILWLHGLGADGHDFEPIVPELRMPETMPIR
jgi:phospholipase/carboxylesterase